MAQKPPLESQEGSRYRRLHSSSASPGPTSSHPSSNSPSSHSQTRDPQLLQVHPLRTNPGPSCPLQSWPAGPSLPVGLRGHSPARTGNVGWQTAHCRRKQGHLRAGESGCDGEYAGCPPPQSPVHPGASTTHTGQGSLCSEGQSTYFRITRLAAWMACSNLGQRRVPFNLGLLTAHCLSPAFGPQSTRPRGALWPGERGGRKNAAPIRAQV